MRTGLDWLDAELAGCADVAVESLTAGDRTAALASVKVMIDNAVYKERLLPSLGEWMAGLSPTENLAGAIPLGASSEDERGQVVDELFSGSVIIVVNGDLFAYPIPRQPERTPEESSSEISVKGPRDGFVESLQVNRALVRKRIKSPDLKIESFSVGTDSRIEVNLLYLKSAASRSLVEEARKRIGRLSPDIVNGAGQIEEMLSDRSRSLFPLVDYTGRPDFIVESLAAGRVAIIVDGLPLVYTAPTNMFELLKSAEDIHNSYYFVTMERLLRLLGLFITLTLPGFWVAVSTFNVDQIPFPLMATIVVSRIGLPISTAIEMFLMLFMFELFREAGVRLPRAVGQTVAVVGGIIVGDAAIRAGLTSPTMLVVSAVTNVTSFTLVNQTLLGSVNLLRFVVLLFSTALGMFGFFIGVFTILLYMVSLRSFGEPYLKPAAPFEALRARGAFLKLPYADRKSKGSPKRGKSGG
ncbi:spore germination protein [Cohnella sp. GbtcB17]|uniref:spore germination protein n=1 Tax=Cohnella sp. GbtcB17 TaxID=2824762 RepID=UPI001C2FF258|nr:spore germination protein [Cohnella sp. GbtcB17]